MQSITHAKRYACKALRVQSTPLNDCFQLDIPGSWHIRQRILQKIMSAIVAQMSRAHPSPFRPKLGKLPPAHTRKVMMDPSSSTGRHIHSNSGLVCWFFACEFLSREVLLTGAVQLKYELISSSTYVRHNFDAPFVTLHGFVRGTMSTPNSLYFVPKTSEKRSKANYNCSQLCLWHCHHSSGCSSCM
jgi:hypothetical protein